MENKLSIWELCTVFGVVAIILSGFMSAVSASPSEGEGDKNNYENIYIKFSNKDDVDISSVYKAKSILQIRDVKSNLTGAQKKLSTDLLQLLDSTFLPYGQDRETIEIQMKRLGQFRPASSVSPATDGRVAGDMVYVYVYLKLSAETRTIEPYVWEVTDRDEENRLAVAWVEVNDLETLASQEEVRTIRTVMPPILRTGSVTTEGDAIHRTYDVRTTYSQSGSGVKVGIISDGVDHWVDARNSGDLPADLTVLSNAQGGDEGTAMLEIVHDMVPDADLYFHDCGANWVAFNDAIDALVGAGCDVVCDDIGWITQPFFEDGIIATHLTTVLASNDIIYASSAGNAGQKHYQGDYYNDSYQFHDFSGGTEPVYKYLYINIPQNGGVTVVLQWNDEFGSSGNNYDLLLYDMSDWSVLASSMYMQDGDDDPIEDFSYTNTAGYSITAEIDVRNYFGHAETKTLEVFVYPNNGAYLYADNIDPADSIFGHPAVPGAIATGAIDASDPGNDDIELFSSQGPVTITYPSPVSRPKPDLCGVDGVAVTGAGGFGYWDGSNYRFYGTSAAAPHIAAIAAQLWGACPSKTGDEIHAVLCDTAIDLGSAGYDNIYGYGMTDALAAFGALDCGIAPPNITSSAPPSPVSDTEGSSGTFGIVVNQTVDVNWYINSTQVQTNTSVAEVSYTNTSAEVGVWNVSAVASNANGTVMQKWVWNVTVAPQTFPCTCGDICVNETGWWRDGGVLNASDTPIQAAVTNATPGETIYVYNGSYTENVNVNERLTLRGEGADVVNVTAPIPDSDGDHVFNVTADYVNISGFNVTGATADWKAGIYLNGASHCNISDNNYTNNRNGIILKYSSNNILTNNTASSNGWGIYLNSSSNNTLVNNTASNNDFDGIYLNYSSNNTLANNTASSNGQGIRLYFSSNNTLMNNTMSINTYNFGVYGKSLAEYTHSIDTNNTVDGKPVYYWVGQQDKQIPSDAGYVGIVNSTNITVRDLVLTKNVYGVGLAGTTNSKIENVTSLNNWDGIRLLHSSSNNTFTENNISGNDCDGIWLYSSSNNNTFTNNTAANNRWDIYIEDSSSTFIDNTLNGTTVSFTYSGDVSLKGEGSPAADPSGQHSIGKFINATNQSVDAWLYLNFSYSITDVSGLDESSLAVWKYNGTTWLEDGWNGVRYLSTTNNIVGVNITTFSVFAPMAPAATGLLCDCGDIYVNTSGWCRDGSAFNVSSTPIQAAVTNATPGETIYVYNGSYTENVNIGKPYLTLAGEGADVVNVNAISTSDYVFEVTADYVNISGFNVSGATGDYKAGIYVTSDKCNISNNIATYNYYGIYLYESSNNTLSGNTASKQYYGIWLDSSSSNILYHNNLVDNDNYNAYDYNGSNQWDFGTEGNYWSDYTGTDSNGDGIGDTPYNISGGAGVQDRYPFMQMNGWMQDVLLVFAITPTSRNAQIGTPVTLFMSVINAGTVSATGVSISQASSLPATLSYQTWNGTALTGSPDTPVVIGSGDAVHYVLTINATAEFASSPMTFDVSCSNGTTGPISGVNTLTLSASATPYADVIMMSTSLDMSMAVNTPTAFAVATTNVGGAEATGVSLIMEIPSSVSGLAYQLNETNPDGSIKGPATGLTIPVGGQPTFAVFLTPTQVIDFDPANNRLMLKFVDGSGKVIGAQSVAVSTT